MNLRLQSDKTLVLVVSGLFLGIAFDFLFYGQWLGINYPFFLVLAVAVTLALTQLTLKSISKSNLVLFALAIFFAGMVFVRESYLLTFFNVLGSLLLLLAVAYSYKGKKIYEYLPLDYAKIFILPLNFIKPLLATSREFINEVFGKLTGNNSIRQEVLRGSTLAVIALLIFGGLFVSADLVFQKFVSNFFNFSFNADTLIQLFIMVVVGAVFLGAFGFMLNTPHVLTPAALKERKFGAIEMKILLGSINLLFFAFVFIQFTYLFGGEAHFLSQGLTYAEYARRGFYEIVLAAILAYLIISVTEVQIIKKDDLHLHSFKWLSSLLIVLVLAILVSAFVRLSLYEDAYGFTAIRLYSHAFMIWLGVVILLLSYKILFEGSRSKFATLTFGSVIILLFSMNMLNPDAFIANKNIERYRNTGKVDTEYLANLSSDAIPNTLILIEDKNQNVRDEFLSNLYSAREFRGAEHVNWKSINLSRLKAQKLLVPYEEVIEAHKGLHFVPLD